MVKVSLGGIRDVHDIKGHLRTYVGSMPGKIMRAMISAGYRNALILLDEIDKVSKEYYSDPSSALLEVLDPEENKKFVDDYIKIPFSLENVIFIATANYFGDIPQPLRDRMEVIQISSYSEFEKTEIFKKYLLKSVYKEMNLSKNKLTFDDDAVVELIRSYS
jgi:ATP-dependent Lon protease